MLSDWAEQGPISLHHVNLKRFGRMFWVGSKLITNVDQSRDLETNVIKWRYPSGQLSSPPELPPYLKKVYDLKPVLGIPSDEEVIGIHAVIRVANQVVDVQDMGDPTLLARLSEHLFNVQMAKYWSKYLGGMFPENTMYIPPVLPAHLIQLAPVAGAPSEQEVIQVQSAIRDHLKYGSSSSMFDLRVDMELSQYLFDIQMARYTQRARQSHVSSIPPETTSLGSTRIIERTADVVDESGTATNNARTGAEAFELDRQVHVVSDSSVHDAIERSNRLAEQANQLARRSNQLIERSNQIAERSNQLMERSTQPAEQSNRLAKKFNEFFEKFNEHLEVSNQLAAESANYAERIGDVLENINRVLVKVQHAIIRMHKGDTKFAVDCLVNENGEIPGASETVGRWDLKSLSEDCAGKANARIPIVVDGVERNIRFPDTNSLKVSGVPEMHDPSLSMKLADHLFNVQMARYRSRHSCITFPSDTAYTPPEPPSHISVHLKPVSGAPSDDEIMQVQDAIQTYQELRRVPSMFGTHMNMKLSQHLFDLQMARYMECAEGFHSGPGLEETAESERPTRVVEPAPNTTQDPIVAANNAGTGANAIAANSTLLPVPGLNVHELMERSNQLAERFNKLLERSNELAERRNQPADYSNSQPGTQGFSQILERLTQLVEQSYRPAERSDRLAERFNELLGCFNQLLEQSHQPTQRANDLAAQANQLAEGFNQSTERSNQLSKRANEFRKEIAGLLGNINQVLVGIQHAIIRVSA
ncbi:unnamed protein product [Rhizoctonia solani]|uniref:Laminin domain protein n=1 Tax=Rhizoctonia solani TaxID=456999 RepID=A0A8H2X8Y0_9AGAM|nr:unnamed protein product [Rhizoctonia solani]